MAVFTGIDLKSWRKAQGVSVDRLASAVSCDETTIYRYESCKLKPNPDIMYQICEYLGDIDKWSDWMRTEYPTSYGRMHPETAAYPLQGALMSMYAEISDVMALQHEAFKDGADGTIDDADLASRIQKEVTEVIQSAQRVRSLIGKNDQ